MSDDTSSHVRFSHLYDELLLFSYYAFRRSHVGLSFTAIFLLFLLFVKYSLRVH